VKNGSNVAESSKEGYGSKSPVLPMMMMMMMMMMMGFLDERNMHELLRNPLRHSPAISPEYNFFLHQ
jgi:hypothetical protein